MSEAQTVFIVFLDGPTGASYPYGVFTNREAAEDARERITGKLADTVRETGNSAFLEEVAGSLDEQIRAEPYELRDSFSDEDVDELFEDTL